MQCYPAAVAILIIVLKQLSHVLNVLEGYHEHLASLPRARGSFDGTWAHLGVPDPRDFGAMVTAAANKEGWTRMKSHPGHPSLMRSATATTTQVEAT